jgi:hypothetical protein
VSELDSIVGQKVMVIGYLSSAFMAATVGVKIETPHGRRKSVTTLRTFLLDCGLDIYLHFCCIAIFDTYAFIEHREWVDLKTYASCQSVKLWHRFIGLSS